MPLPLVTPAPMSLLANFLWCWSLLLLVQPSFFFFQAEDGIRDGHVTGVQTCALPISMTSRAPDHHWGKGSLACQQRSEERRVGKECRDRWTPYHYKKTDKNRDELM